ncbi:MAG: MFS transporter, partial [Prosthecobacter sp.]|nr:MFS transporter [Prosthecobacter sp.]
NTHAVRRNFICHCLEGGLYMGGTAFLAPESVLPKMVETLGGRAWIIAMVPVLLPAAYASMGIFIAPIIERLPRFKPWVLTFGLLQRLPYLITGLILLFSDKIEGSLLFIVALTPVISGLIGGMTVVAWMEMVTRMVPEKARAAGWAVRYIIQAVIGILAGTVIHQVLTHYPKHVAYGWLHLIAFSLLFVSWMSQLFMREDEHTRQRHPTPPRGPYLDYLRSLPAILRTQPHLMKLVIARFTGMGYLMVVSFLTIHALHVTNRPEADEGHFVTYQAVGVVLGSLLAGWVGYKCGGKILLQSSRIVCIGLCIWVAKTESFNGFMLAYFILGFGLFLDRVGDLTLAAELCPPERRSTLQAILGFCNVFALLLATFISGQIYAWSHSFEIVTAVAAVFAIISMIVLHRIPEPRLAAVQKNS